MADDMISRQLLNQFLTERTALDNSSIEHITSHFEQVKTKRNQLLEAEGQICKHFYFIERGCLRLCQINEKGNEITASFALENRFMTALTSFITQKPSKDFLVTLEPSDLLVITREHFFTLTEQFVEFRFLYHQIIEFAFIHSQMRIYSFLGMEGIDKIRWVIQHEPELLTRISSKSVASYLGMTNSTLSKLKAKL